MNGLREQGDRLLAFAALSAAIAIAAGAFGAHGAANADAVEWLRTGGSYQLIHAVAAVALARRYPLIALWLLIGAGWFATTLYLMALGAPRWLGALTPLGGVVMIGGWLALAWTALSTAERGQAD